METTFRKSQLNLFYVVMAGKKRSHRPRHCSAWGGLSESTPRGNRRDFPVSNGRDHLRCGCHPDPTKEQGDGAPLGTGPAGKAGWDAPVQGPAPLLLRPAPSGAGQTHRTALKHM